MKMLLMNTVVALALTGMMAVVVIAATPRIPKQLQLEWRLNQ